MAARTAVYLEIGNRRVFAVAVDWPGWCRAGKGEEAALEALADYRPRYAAVAAVAREKLPSDASFQVIERIDGSATTDFGAPGSVPEFDRTNPDARARRRLAGLVRASWTVFDDVVAKAPKELRKGPRGGGRDTDAIARHVAEAEVMYAQQLGLRLKHNDREALAEALLNPVPEAKWPMAYAVRRIAWHVLDHAWEIEDRSS